MTPELAKTLEDNGFPFDGYIPVLGLDINGKPVELEYYVTDRFPTLSGLIETLGDSLRGLEHSNGEWIAVGPTQDISGKTPEEAVAKLWLALK